tara:strand:- start:16640 stop:17983 length:1344 start_codon:yes stop_codon:yes gene_type:complete
MAWRQSLLTIAISLIVSCASSRDLAGPKDLAAPVRTASNAPSVWKTLVEQLTAPAVANAFPGEDDGSSAATTNFLVHAALRSWKSIEPPPGAHPMVCDLAWFDDSIWVSFGNKTISTDGARIYSWNPRRGWKLEFNWDRGGAAGVTHERGGQGISRLRVLGDALYATDADAPNFGGFGISDAPLEGYVFVADREGFGPLRDGDLPPAQTLIVPLAFHVFDITKYQGHLVASGGTLAPPGARSRYPGGLFVQGESGELWPRFFPGIDTKSGVVRATFMHRFRGRLYVGFQNNEKRMQWDLGVVDGDPSLAATELVLGRVTKRGGWKTRHFASDAESLYWIAGDTRRRGLSSLFRSNDGRSFSEVALGAKIGEPHDVLAAAGSALVLADAGLFRLGADGASSEVLAAPPGKPFARRDGFCSAAMTATPLGLFAGSTNGLGIYFAEPDPK